MAEAVATATSQARAELMHQAEAIAMADMPNIPIYYYVSKDLVSPKRQGLGRQHQGHPPHALALRSSAERPRAAAAGRRPRLRASPWAPTSPAASDQHPDAAGDHHPRVLHDADRARAARSTASARCRRRSRRTCSRPTTSTSRCSQQYPRYLLRRPARRLRAVVQVPATSPSPSCWATGFPASLKVGGLAIVLAVLLGLGARHARGAAPEQLASTTRSWRPR